jgi:hypothetical protein
MIKMNYSPERRTVEEKNHLLCYLKFRVPFFENYDKDMIFMIVERLEPKIFKDNDISNLHQIQTI